MTDWSKKVIWNIPDHWMQIETVEMHTGGEPLRIPIKGLPEIKGNTVLEKRNYFKKYFDYIRTGLMFEPRGHADMYGAVLSESSTEDAHFDAFFIHNEGYSTMCGHATIALIKFVVESGLFDASKNSKIAFNVPCGKVTGKFELLNNIVGKSSFINVPSFLYMRDQEVEVPGLGRVGFDIGYGGAFYAIVKVEDIDISLNPSSYNQLIDYGKRIKKAVASNFPTRHPIEEDLSFLYGTIFTGPAQNASIHSRNVCIFAEGEVDRSATGSGVSARAALHFAKGELGIGEEITIESILGTTMTVKAIDHVDYEGYPSVISEVSGTSHFVGRNSYVFDPADPINKGFIFR